MPLFITGTTTLAIGGMVLLYTIQFDMLYPSNWPIGSRKFVARPSKYGIPYSEVTISTKDNVRLKAFVCKRPIDKEARKRPTILMFHVEHMTANTFGLNVNTKTKNKISKGHQLPIAERFYKDFKCNVVMLSYRGYGRSEGTPSEKGLRIDAQAALDYIKKNEVFKDTKLIIYGQSLGGAVAIDLVSKNEEQVDALIIENTFLIPHLVPQLRYLTFLCIQIWPSDKSIKKIKQTPILFLSGTKDEIIPQQHMKSLYELAQPRGGKEWKEFSNGMHNDTILQPGYFQNIGWFIKRNVCLDE
ncbi:44550_t:CDS:2 [Gigaspora margarita]|uniref:44550_t:CDS:1 n=1 Tax=Gigaspora margarita TaxID=4874 RepID=A0ABN7VPY6_GIGMA|nr:44550_t:CDS:2 [Gigaspora margarita]